MTDSKGKLFKQSLAGAFYGMGAALAGTDPTGLAVQLQANRERRMKREQLEGAQAALMAADKDRYEKFMSGMPEGFQFRDVETHNTLWNTFLASEEQSRVEADATGSLPYLSDRLKEFGRDPSAIMNSNTSDLAKAQEMRRILEPLEVRALEIQEENERLGAMYEGMSTADVRSFAEESGLSGVENLSRDELIQGLNAARVSPVSMTSGSALQVEDRRDWVRLEQLVGVPAEELQAIANDENIAFGEEKEILDKAIAAKAQLDRDRVKYNRSKSSVEAITARMLLEVKENSMKGFEAEKAFDDSYNAMILQTFGEKGIPPHFAEDMVMEYAKAKSELGLAVTDTAAAQAWAADPNKTSLVALSTMEDGDFKDRIKSLPEVQKQQLTERRTAALDAVKNRDYLRQAVAAVGGAQAVAGVYGLQDFVPGGEFEDLLYEKGLDEMDSGELAALTEVNQSVRLADIQRAGPLLQGVVSMGMADEDQVAVLTAIRNGTLTSDPAASAAIIRTVDTALAPIAAGGEVSSSEVIGLSQTLVGLQKFSELEGVTLPPAVAATLDRNAHVVQAVQNFPHIVEGKSFDQAWNESREIENVGDRWASFHEDLWFSPGPGAAEALQGLMSPSPSVRSQAYHDLRLEASAGWVLSTGRSHVRAFTTSGNLFGDLKIEDGVVRLKQFDLTNPKDVQRMISAEGTSDLSFLAEMGVAFSPDFISAQATDDAKWTTRAGEIFGRLVGKSGLVEAASSAQTDQQKAAYAIQINAQLKYAVGKAILEKNANLNTFFGVPLEGAKEGDAFGSTPAGIAEEALENWRDTQLLVAERLMTQPLQPDESFGSWNALALTAATGYEGAEVIVAPPDPEAEAKAAATKARGKRSSSETWPKGAFPSYPSMGSSPKRK